MKLNEIEQIEYQTELNTFTKPEQDSVMQITTSWMEQGREQGANREKELIMRQLKRKLGEISPEVETQVKALNIDTVELLGEALFDLDSVDDLTNWLSNHR